ncbi:zinc ribbon domain-containing protein [Streptomyces sp. NPDC005811]|uniref:zinc ribbon domain-containing protein n=1 Tax=Streptomyces sp. NPDC005811 TaxID=3154565 RepID=UPI0033F20D3B
MWWPRLGVPPTPLRQWGSTGRGIALEELTGIRERVRLRKPQRATHSSWSFAQLGAFIAYKAKKAGVPVVYVDAAYTSRTCAECGHIDRANRVSQAWFACRSCGFVDHADRNSSRNIRRRAEELWRRGAQARDFSPGSLTRTSSGFGSPQWPQPHDDAAAPGGGPGGVAEIVGITVDLYPPGYDG